LKVFALLCFAWSKIKKHTHNGWQKWKEQQTEIEIARRTENEAAAQK